MALSAKDIQFQELKDTISQLNTTISAQNALIVQFQKTIEAAEIRDDGHIHFTIRKVKLYECSVVAFPAYEETNIASRAKDAETARLREAEAKRMALEAWKEKTKNRLKGDSNDGTQSINC